MIEFETLCYLQNHKTGCSFVEALLRRFCIEDIVRYEKHRPLYKHKAGKFYFINVREPLDAYGSLYRYGLDGKGELYMRLRNAGKSALYDRGPEGFVTWLDFLLDANNAGLVMPDCEPTLANIIGLLSWRYLRLATVGPGISSTENGDRDTVRAYANSQNIIDSVVRFECLHADLQNLLTGPIEHAFHDIPTVSHWLESAPRINASTIQASSIHPKIGPTLREKLIQREWYLYEKFYHPDGSLRDSTIF